MGGVEAVEAGESRRPLPKIIEIVSWVSFLIF